MLKLTLICAGGALGSLLRYLLAGAAQPADVGFPVGTLIVNVVGCFVIGALSALFAGPHLIREEYRLAVMIGLLGGFTTFSSFAWESFALANDGQIRLALINVVASNLFGLTAAWIGYRISQRCFGI